MANAKAKGRQVGRRPTNKDDIPAIFYKHYPAYVAGQMNERERICDLSRPDVHIMRKFIYKSGRTQSAQGRKPALNYLVAEDRERVKGGEAACEAP